MLCRGRGRGGPNGAWAGPVTVCAVIVPAGLPRSAVRLTDPSSSPRRRATMAGELLSWVEAFAIGEAEPAEIDAAGMTAALRRQRSTPWRTLGVRTRCCSTAPMITSAVPGRCAVRYGPTCGRRRSPRLRSSPRCTGTGCMAALGPSKSRSAERRLSLASAPPEALVALGPTPYHRLSWSYLDDLPRWRRRRRGAAGYRGAARGFAGTGAETRRRPRRRGARRYRGGGRRQSQQAA